METEKQRDYLIGKLNDLNKKAALYFYSFAGLVFSSGFFLFSKHGGDSVKIPFLSVDVERWNALEILILLSFISLLQFSSLCSLNGLFRNKLSKKCKVNSIFWVTPTTLSLFVYLYPKLLSPKYVCTSIISMLSVPIVFCVMTGYYQFHKKGYIPWSWVCTMVIDLALIGLILITAHKILSNPK